VAVEAGGVGVCSFVESEPKYRHSDKIERRCDVPRKGCLLLSRARVAARCLRRSEMLTGLGRGAHT
jgi:hypothetical protein